MFDIGWLELIVIGIVALIVVGPKDLPGLFRTVGQFMGRARGMAREFQRSMEDAADEAGVKDISKTIRTATNPLNEATKAARNYSKSVLDEATPNLTADDLGIDGDLLDETPPKPAATQTSAPAKPTAEPAAKPAANPTLAGPDLTKASDAKPSEAG